MEQMVWTGKPLKVRVNPEAPGKWPKQPAQRDVYALGYLDGDTKVLVVDDGGTLQWLGQSNYSVPVAPAITRD